MNKFYSATVPKAVLTDMTKINSLNSANYYDLIIKKLNAAKGLAGILATVGDATQWEEYDVRPEDLAETALAIRRELENALFLFKAMAEQIGEGDSQ